MAKAVRALSWRVPAGLAVVLLAAALFRALYFHAYHAQGILFDGMILDASIYDGWAQRIAGGEWIGRESFHFAPLYPYLLAGVYAIVGHSYAAVYALQFLLGLSGLALLHAIAVRLHGGRAALFTVAGAALYLPFVFFETKVLGASLGLLLAIAALGLLARAEEIEDGRRARAWALAGAVIGLMALCTPAALLLAIIYAVALLLRRRPRAAAALLAGAIAAVLPALAHNLAASGDWQLVSSQGGVTFWQGNNPEAAGLFMPPPGFTGAPDRQADEERTVAESETGRPLRRSEIGSHFLRKGLRFMVTSPGRWLALEARKAAYLVGSYEPSTEYSPYLERERMPLLHAAFLPFAVVAGLALGGMLAGGGAPPGGRRALALYTAWAAAVPLLFYVSTRYRLPLVPALLIYAGAFVDRLAASVGDGGRIAMATARAALAAMVLAMVSFFLLGTPQPTVEANAHYNLGNLLADRGLHAEAVVEYDRCLAAWPGHAFALINRGNSLDRLGRGDDAVASYRRAVEVRPGLWSGWEALGGYLVKAGRKDEAAGVYHEAAKAGAGGGEAWFSLGTVLLDLGTYEEARVALRQAVGVRPKEPRYHNSLGMALQKAGDDEAAMREFAEASRVGPRYAKSRTNLGTLLLAAKRLPEARQQFEAALAIEPDNVKARVRLADVFALTGERDRARAEYQRALTAAPNDGEARAGLQRLGAAAQAAPAGQAAR